MTAFGMLVKSYGADFDYAARLIDSYRDHNVTGIPLVFVVPDLDTKAFGEFADETVTVLPESTFAEHLTATDRGGYLSGYLNQAVIKLCFWEIGIFDNYLCLDSDAEFIRDFRVGDFMADTTVPYTFLSEDAELISEPEYYQSQWQYRESRLMAIKDEIGVTERRLLTVHGHAVFSAAVLRSFRDNFLVPRGWDYIDALSFSPYEPTWYNMWLQHDHTIPTVMREPIFKTFHNASQHLEYLLHEVTKEEMARGYVGIIVNSNYSRGGGVVSVDDPRAQTLATYVGFGDLARAAIYSAWWRLTFRGAFISGLRHRIGALLGRGPREG